MKTREEVDDLKRQWQNDPCWDLENTEGFEDYHDELYTFRKEYEAEQDRRWQNRITVRATEWECSRMLAAHMIMIEGDYETKIERLHERIDKLQAMTNELSRRITSESRSVYAMIESVERDIRDLR